MSTLAELRRQNIAEQKADEAEQLANDPPAPVDTETEQPESSASTEIRKPVRTQARKEASTDGRKQASTQGRKQALKQVRESVSTDGLAARVREALELKRNHTGGVKATVEMSPELSKRAKTYCLEQGVSSVRVLCLELLEAFLSEEGF